MRLPLKKRVVAEALGTCFDSYTGSHKEAQKKQNAFEFILSLLCLFVANFYFVAERLR